MSKRGKSARQAAPPPAASAPAWLAPSAWIAPAFLVWAAVVLVLYLRRAPVSLDPLLQMADHLLQSRLLHPYTWKMLRGAAVAIWLSWLAVQIGQRLLARWRGAEDWAGLERLTIGLGLGLGTLSFFTFLAGAAQAWYAALFWVVLGGLSAAFLVWRRPLATATARPLVRGPWQGLWLALSTLLLLLFFWGGLTPEIFYDALYYHIAVPNLYKIAHGLYAIPTMLFSSFALTIQMLWGLALTLDHEIAAKLLHVATAVGLFLAYRAMEGRFFSPGNGAIAGLLLLSVPIVGINVVTTGTDVAWSFLQLLAAFALLRAFQEEGRSWLYLAGALTGLSASCKYPGFAYAPIACLLVVWQRRSDRQASWRDAALDAMRLALPIALILAPILLRNVFFHGNPLYPFGGTRWGHPAIDPHYWKIFVADANTRNLAAEFADARSALRFLLHPWFLTMEGGGNGGLLGPLLLLFLPLIFLLRAPSPAYRWLRRYTALLWLLWLLTSTTPRYGLPALAMLTPLLAEAILALARRPVARWGALGALLVGAVGNLNQFLGILYATAGWTVVGGFQSEAAYLSRMHATYPTPPYAGIRWMNENLPEGSKILFIGEARSHYTRHAVVPSSVPDPQPLVLYARQAADGDAMAAHLRRDGVTHLYLNMAEAVRTEGYGLFPWDAASWKTLEDFWGRHVEGIWKVEEMTPGQPNVQYVYRLRGAEEAGPPRQIPANPFERWKPK